MSAASFESDFIDDLESFVKKPIQIDPIEIWDARETAAPERHYALGKLSNLSVDTQLYMLRDNYAFQDIESLLHMTLHAVEYAECNEIHPVKEQVWLFGIRWLNRYMKFLAMPGTLRKEFYRRHNDRFLDLLGCLVTYNPAERISFYEALRIWDPRHPALQTSGSTLPRKGSVDAVVSTSADVLPAAVPAVINDAYVSDHSNPAQSSVSEAAVVNADHHPAAAPICVEGRRRLNLKRHYDSVGRTKTRKACN